MDAAVYAAVFVTCTNACSDRQLLAQLCPAYHTEAAREVATTAVGQTADRRRQVQRIFRNSAPRDTWAPASHTAHSDVVAAAL